MTFFTYKINLFIRQGWLFLILGTSPKDALSFRLKGSWLGKGVLRAMNSRSRSTGTWLLWLLLPALLPLGLLVLFLTWIFLM
jgi:hypothetical protein